VGEKAASSINDAERTGYQYAENWNRFLSHPVWKSIQNESKILTVRHQTLKLLQKKKGKCLKQ
jgi:hypothetical protein